MAGPCYRESNKGSKLMAGPCYRESNRGSKLMAGPCYRESNRGSKLMAGTNSWCLCYCKRCSSYRGFC